jgi:RNA chaperone Hfq
VKVAIKSLEKIYIDNLITSKLSASIYLKNSIRLKGHLIFQDDECVFLKAAETQMIYKAKISTICPEFSFERF